MSLLLCDFQCKPIVSKGERQVIDHCRQVANKWLISDQSLLKNALMTYSDMLDLCPSFSMKWVSFDQTRRRLHALGGMRRSKTQKHTRFLGKATRKLTQLCCVSRKTKDPQSANLIILTVLSRFERKYVEILTNRTTVDLPFRSIWKTVSSVKWLHILILPSNVLISSIREIFTHIQ